MHIPRPRLIILMDCVYVHVYACVCMCVCECVFTGAEEGRRQEPSFLSGDRAAEALEIILPQRSGSEPANVKFPSQIMH